MKNVVSAEMARNLKAAGFRQPEYDFGQIWYNANGIAFIVSKFHDDLIFGQIDFSSGIAEDPKNMVFAPTATDILYAINSPKCRLRNLAMQFECGYAGQEPFYHENAAEAAALAWFQKYGK